MRTKLLLGVSFIAVAALSFYAGGTFILSGGSFAMFSDAPDVDYSTLSGMVVSYDGESLVIRVEDGGTVVVPLAQDTRLLVTPLPILATPADLVAGAVVSVTLQDAVAETIQILASPANQ